MDNVVSKAFKTRYMTWADVTFLLAATLKVLLVSIELTFPALLNYHPRWISPFKINETVFVYWRFHLWNGKKLLPVLWHWNCSGWISSNVRGLFWKEMIIFTCRNYLWHLHSHNVSLMDHLIINITPTNSITAHGGGSPGQDPFGIFVFDNARIFDVGKVPLSSTYLGRAWGPAPKVLWQSASFPASINPDGWSMNPAFGKPIRWSSNGFYEYPTLRTKSGHRASRSLTKDDVLRTNNMPWVVISRIFFFISTLAQCVLSSMYISWIDLRHVSISSWSPRLTMLGGCFHVLFEKGIGVQFVCVWCVGIRNLLWYLVEGSWWILWPKITLMGFRYACMHPLGFAKARHPDINVTNCGLVTKHFGPHVSWLMRLYQTP